MKENLLSDLMLSLATLSLRATVAAGLILLVQAGLGRWLPARWRYALWVPFFLVLLLPVLPGSPLSLERLWARGGEAAGFARTAMPDLVVRAGEAEAVPVLMELESGADRGSGLAFPGWGVVGAGVWLTGLAGLMWWGVRERRRQWQAIRGAAVAVPGEVRTMVERAVGETGLRRFPEVVMSAAVEGPAVTGMGRPVLLLPADFPEGLSARQAALILRHEAVHLKHRDTLWDGVLWVLTLVHWFNPAIRLAVLRLRADREAARDAEVLARAGVEDRAAYGEALLNLQLTPAAVLCGLRFSGLVSAGNGLRRRIAGLARHGRIRPGWHVAGVMLAGLVLLLSGRAAVEAADKKEERKPAVNAEEVAQQEPAVVRKAKGIIVDRVQFKNATPGEAVDYMRRKSIEADSATTEHGKKGVDLILKNGKTQDAKIITLDLKNVSVYQGLLEIAKQSGLVVSADLENPEAEALILSEPGSVKQVARKIGNDSAALVRAGKVIVKRVQFSDASLGEAARYLSAISKQPDFGGNEVKVSVAPEVEDRMVTLELRDIRYAELIRTVARMANCQIKANAAGVELVPLK